MPKLDNPQGEVDTVANANELKEQLDAVTAEKVTLGNEKATLEQSVTVLTDENTQLKTELQELKDLLTDAELKASGQESLAKEVEVQFNNAIDELDAYKTEAEAKTALLNKEIAENLVKIQDLESKVTELTVEVVETTVDAEIAKAIADVLVEQTDNLDKHLQVRGAKPQLTNVVEGKDKTDAIAEFKELKRQKQNARNRADQVEYARQLRNLQSSDKGKFIQEYLNEEYSPVKPTKEAVFISDADKAVYDEYKDWTSKRAKAMSEPGTLEQRRKNQATYQREATKMLADPVKAAAIRRAQAAQE